MPTENRSYTFPKSVHFRCTRCALCCGDTKTRVRHILLLEEEARQISNAVCKPVEEFASRIEDHEPYVYEIKKTGEKQKCLFLTGNVCAIYASRPLVCRFYPFQLGTGKESAYKFSYTKECPGVRKGKKLRKDHFECLFHQARRKLGCVV